MPKTPKNPKSLADYIVSTRNRLNKAAFEAGQFLYGINSPKKSTGAAKEAPPEKVVAAAKVAPSTPTPQPKTEQEKKLLQLERELEALRLDYKAALDDIDRNALHFKILRIERAKQNLIGDNS